MKRRYNKSPGYWPVLAVLLMSCLFFTGAVSTGAATAAEEQTSTTASTAVTVYKGVDYSKVYNFEYYVAHNSYVKKHYADNPKGALKYFVKKGMKKRQVASADFNVNSYINGKKVLRRRYKNDYKKYYLHYIKKGYKYKSFRKAATGGLTKMTDYCVRYAGVDYSRVYDYNYYVSHNEDVKKNFGVDDLAAFEDFMERGIYLGLQGNATFNVKKYMEANPSLKKKYGSDYEKYYTYYAKTGKGKLVASKTTTKTSAETESEASDTDYVPITEADLEEETTTPTASKKLGYTSRKYANQTINGKRTLKSYLQNALVPCGRTLYIWGGGWDDSDASIIGYQKKWQKFFKKHASSGYDYTNYRYSYGNGLDCSGFAAWTLYNTLYTKSGGAWLVYQSTTVASTYYKKGWAKLSKYSQSQTYKPGDVVSMDGHVWISLGQCSDKSVLLVHSSPKGVQISGTSGKAAKLAAHYMKKYFPEWPYAARTVGSSYLNYVGKARWKVTGKNAILSDPDGIQKMSANQVMKVLLGS